MMGFVNFLNFRKSNACV